MLQVEGAVYSDVGHVRQKNEDNFYYNGRFRKGYELSSTYDQSFETDGAVQVYAISDGMGGMARGEIAARIAVSELGALERDLRAGTGELDHSEIDDYLNERNNYIVQRNLSADEADGQMGATISVLILRNNSALLANMGDSAVFHFRDGWLKQISRDDSHAGRLRSLGLLTGEEASKHPMRHSLINYLGKEANGGELSYFLVDDIEPRVQDLFLLCSDGISGVLPRDTIRNVLADETSVQAKVHDLVNLAEAAGSSDNITLILIEIRDLREDVASDLPDTEETPDSDTLEPVEPVQVYPHGEIKLKPVANVNPPEAPEETTVAPVRRSPGGLTQEQEDKYLRARAEAVNRQNQRKEKEDMRQKPLPSPEQPAKPANPYERPREGGQNPALKQRMYDQRYSDGTAPVEQPAPAPRARRRQRRGGIRRFLSWLVFLLVFTALGYGIVWLLINGRQYLPF